MKMPGLSQDEVRDWLAGPNIARLGTSNGDGSPRVTALWYLAEQDGTITLNTYEDKRPRPKHPARLARGAAGRFL